MVAMEICGSSQRKNGTRKRDVCSAESTPVEPMKITPSQISRGSQYLRKGLSLVFNEAVSVWESFPFTTDEKLPGRKGGSRAPQLARRGGGDVIYLRLRRHFLASSSPTDEGLLESPAQTSRSRHPPWQCAMAWLAAAATFPKLSHVST